jgi:hypothetical protein
VLPTRHDRSLTTTKKPRRPKRPTGAVCWLRPEFHAPSGFCEPAGRPVTSWE